VVPYTENKFLGLAKPSKANLYDLRGPWWFLKSFQATKN